MSKNSIAVDYKVTSERFATQVSERTHRRSFGLAQIVIIAGALWLTLAFGGVHYWAYLPWRFVLFLALFVLLASAWPTAGQAFERKSTARSFLSGLVLLACYVPLQLLATQVPDIAHPVLGAAVQFSRLQPAWDAWNELVAFIALFCLARIWIHHSASRRHRLQLIIMLAGSIAALIGLAHWFSDNGRLFWIFEPDHVEVSPRARWPFVNPNHLGHYLILPFALQLGLFVVSVQSLRAAHNRMRTAQTRSVDTRKIGNLAVSAMLVLVSSLAILGTLSRGTWIGVTCALLVFSLLSNIFGQAKRWQKFLILLLSVGLSALVLVAFLRGRGMELIEQRLAYGLLSSKEDIRWELTARSGPIFKEHLWLGVGLGSWEQVFERRMPVQLARIKPVYLHNDILQLMIECGLIGFALLALPICLGLKRALGKISKFEPRERILALAPACGCIGLLIAACFDFPFRIPAINYITALGLALFCSRIDEIENNDVASKTRAG